jgi:hypothetical protein
MGLSMSDCHDRVLIGLLLCIVIIAIALGVIGGAFLGYTTQLERPGQAVDVADVCEDVQVDDSRE